MYVYFFFMKIKGVFSYLGMYVYSFFPKNTSVRLFGYVWLIFFCQKYRCTILVCTFIFFLPIFHHALSKGEVHLSFFSLFSTIYYKMVCTVIVFTLSFHYVRLFGYVRLLFFPKQSTMYGYSGMYLYSEPNSRDPYLNSCILDIPIVANPDSYTNGSSGDIFGEKTENGLFLSFMWPLTIFSCCGLRFIWSPTKDIRMKFF